MLRRMLVTAIVVMRMILLVFVLTTALLFQENFARQFFFAVDEDVHLGGRDAGTTHTRNFQTRSNVESGDCILEELRRDASIYQGAKKHVAAHAGEAVEIGNSHGRNPSLAIGPWSLASRSRSFKVDQGQHGGTSKDFANDQRPMANDLFSS